MEATAKIEAQMSNWLTNLKSTWQSALVIAAAIGFGFTAALLLNDVRNIPARVEALEVRTDTLEHRSAAHDTALSVRGPVISSSATTVQNLNDAVTAIASNQNQILCLLEEQTGRRAEGDCAFSRLRRVP